MLAEAAQMQNTSAVPLKRRVKIDRASVIAVEILPGDMIRRHGYAEPSAFHDLNFFIQIVYPVQDEDLRAVYLANNSTKSVG